MHHHPLSRCVASLMHLSPSLATSLASWISWGHCREALESVPVPQALVLLGNGGSRFLDQAELLEGENAAAALASVSDRRQGFLEMWRGDLAPVIRLGFVLEAAWRGRELCRPAGRTVPDWLYALIRDMLSHWGPTAYTSGLDALAGRTSDLPFLDAEFLVRISRDGGVGQDAMLRLVLERQEVAAVANYDILLCLPGMGEWLLERRGTVAKLLRTLHPSGRRNLAAMVGHWKLQEQFASQLAELAVDKASEVRDEAARQLALVSPQLRAAELGQILSKGPVTRSCVAARLLGGFPDTFSQEILAKAVATHQAPALRIALEGALEHHHSARPATQVTALELPGWNAYPVPVLGDDVRDILRRRHRQLLTKARKDLERRAASGESVVSDRQLCEQLDSIDPDRVFECLSRLEPVPVPSQDPSGWLPLIEIFRKEKQLLVRPDFGLHRVLLLTAPFCQGRVWRFDLFRSWLEAQDPDTVDLRAIAQALADLGFDDSGLVEACVGSDEGDGFPQEILPSAAVWPFFAGRTELLRDLVIRVSERDPALGKREQAAILCLAGTFPIPPSALVAPLLDIAMGKVKGLRRPAQDALIGLPGILDRVASMLDHPSHDQRSEACRWLVRLDRERAMPILESRLLKESHEAVRKVLMAAIAAPEASPDA